MRLTAYRLGPGARLEPASRWRDWMDATDRRFANRCLPLLMANQSGWHLVLEHGVRARWNGGPRRRDIEVESASPLGPTGHFGHGVLTFHAGYLFGTDPGWNLLVRGPANMAKDGIAPLEGLVESDWSAATFTVNWRFTRPGEVEWDAGEPFALIVPQRRGELEGVQPRLLDLGDEPEVNHRHREWRDSRREFLTALRAGDGGARERAWERHYFRGTTPGGETFDGHQTVLRLSPFQAQDGAC